MALRVILNATGQTYDAIGLYQTVSPIGYHLIGVRLWLGGANSLSDPYPLDQVTVLGGVPGGLPGNRGLLSSPTEPDSPVPGQVWFNSSGSTIAGVPPGSYAVWNGTGWVVTGTAAPSTGVISSPAEPASPAPGAVWFNSSGSTIAGVPPGSYAVWNGTGWIVTGNQAPSVTGGAAVDPETIDDRVAALLQAGDNITLDYNDSAGTLTINAAGADQEAIDNRVSQILRGDGKIVITDDRPPDVPDTTIRISIPKAPIVDFQEPPLPLRRNYDRWLETTLSDEPIYHFEWIWDAGLSVWKSPLFWHQSVLSGSAANLFDLALPPITVASVSPITTVRIEQFHVRAYVHAINNASNYHHITLSRTDPGNTFFPIYQFNTAAQAPNTWVRQSTNALTVSVQVSSDNLDVRSSIAAGVPGTLSYIFRVGYRWIRPA